jgi:pantoate kinase
VVAAEVENGTGLGTVGTQTKRGFIIKKTAGIPFRFYRLPFTGEKLYAITIDELKSPGILKNEKNLKKIETAADIALSKIYSTPKMNLNDLIEVSYEFVKDSHLLTDERLIKIINKIKSAGHSATMAILGNVVITAWRPNFPLPYTIHELAIT